MRGCTLVAAATDATKRLTNQGSEYWYMGSMLARSVMQKNRIAVYAPQGSYAARAAYAVTHIQYDGLTPKTVA